MIGCGFDGDFDIIDFDGNDCDCCEEVVDLGGVVVDIVEPAVAGPVVPADGSVIDRRQAEALTAGQLGVDLGAARKSCPYSFRLRVDVG